MTALVIIVNNSRRRVKISILVNCVIILYITNYNKSAADTFGNIFPKIRKVFLS